MEIGATAYFGQPRLRQPLVVAVVRLGDRAPRFDALQLTVWACLSANFRETFYPPLALDALMHRFGTQNTYYRSDDGVNSLVRPQKCLCFGKQSLCCLHFDLKCVRFFEN